MTEVMLNRVKDARGGKPRSFAEYGSG